MEKMKFLVERGADVNMQNEVSTNFSAMSFVKETKKRKKIMTMITFPPSQLPVND